MIAYLCLSSDTIICLVAIICSILVVLRFFASPTTTPHGGKTLQVLEFFELILRKK
jgi:hypothetical protein